MLKKLEDADYRQIFKDWVNRQPDERTYVFVSSSQCAVGQFLRDHPEFNGGVFGYDATVPMWRATHGPSLGGGSGGPDYLEAICGGRAFEWQTFGDLKARLNSDPLWA